MALARGSVVTKMGGVTTRAKLNLVRKDRWEKRTGPTWPRTRSVALFPLQRCWHLVTELQFGIPIKLKS